MEAWACSGLSLPLLPWSWASGNIASWEDKRALAAAKEIGEQRSGGP